MVVSFDEIRWVRASARAWVDEAEVGGWRRGGGRKEERRKGSAVLKDRAEQTGGAVWK
jgi:hypothetical protein